MTLTNMANKHFADFAGFILLSLILCSTAAVVNAAIDNAEANTIEILRSEIDPDGRLIPELIGDFSYSSSSSNRNHHKQQHQHQHVAAVDAGAQAPLENPYAHVPDENPCVTHNCEAGQSCVILDDGLYVPTCECIAACPERSEGGGLVAVCSNFNTTFESECDLYRQRCLCQRNLPGCDDTRNADLNTDYMTACKEIPECTEKDMSDFPHRMAEWLFIVMRELAQREELSSAFVKLERKAQRMYEPGSNRPVPPHPILWKFCDLDHDPNDRYIGRAELLELEMPLKSMESCLVPFLDDCDVNNDHKISLAEWGKCLKLGDDQIEDICNYSG